MMDRPEPERIQTVVIGGGQTGMSVGYHLARRKLPFVILDAHQRIGDAWRHRWDSLRVFTPARFCGLDGLAYPGPRHYFPTKDEYADYLEAYAQRFRLPVRTGVRVERVSRNGHGFLVEAGERAWEAEHVVVAVGGYQRPWRPAFADQLDSGIHQLHSVDYRNPSQLRRGPVLVVGAANSGAEIAAELAHEHRVWLAGRHPGHVPFRIESAAGRVLVPLVLRGLFHRVLSLRTPIGRKKRSAFMTRGRPLVRTRPKELAAAGVERVGRVEGVRDGRPVLAGGRTLDVANVVWCTGFRSGLAEWIDLPVFGELEPRHHRGVVDSQPGLYFMGLMFQYAASSEMFHGVGRDAAYVVNALANRLKATRSAAARVKGGRS